MKMKKFNGFDENGYLPYGMYNMTFDEFKENFCKKSVKREDIFKEYEKHLKEIIDTGYFLDHWIDGSFVSKKENPNDIDSLTDLMGKKSMKIMIIKKLMTLLIIPNQKLKDYVILGEFIDFQHLMKKSIWLI